MALQALKMSYDPSSGGFTLEIEGMENIGDIINTESLLEEKLTDLIVELGNIANKDRKYMFFYRRDAVLKKRQY